MTTDRPAFERAAELYRLGKWPEAAAACREILAREPQHIEALRLLGRAGHQLGELAEAIDSYRKAECLRPDLADLPNKLAAVCLAAGQYDEAADACERALRLQPSLLEAHLTLGNVRYAQGRLNEAAASYQAVLAIDPRYGDALNNLGLVQKSLGQLDQAAECFQRVLQLHPSSPGAWLNLGNVYKEQGRHADAITALHCAIQLAPGYAQAHQNLGELLDTEGRVEETTAYYHEALRLSGKAALRLQIAMALPPIYDSNEQLQSYRNQLVNELDVLSAEGVRFNPLKDRLPNWFYLAYQGLDDRAIHESIARLCVADDDDRGRPCDRSPRPDNRIRIGFVSSFLKDHTIGQLFRGLIDRLSRERFHVSVVSLQPARDDIAQQIRASADAAIELPKDLSLARQQIANLQLDVLLYTDLGMDPAAYALASYRLAAVQCTSWGHPVTSGLPTVDYFISSTFIEPSDGQNYYAERLVELPVLPAYYYRPQTSQRRLDRAHFGIQADRHVYLCPHNLFKFHPDFDVALREILERDPQADIVLIEGRYPYWTERLKQRFSRTIPVGAAHIRFLPSQSRPDFLQLIAAADVMLDTFHFGGGNTSYEAIGVGTPVITLPSNLMRGRVTYGCYRQMDVLDCVATNQQQYVDLAVELATDRERRDAISKRLLDASHLLFENHQAVEALEKFLERAVSEI
jgi:predicted O-linked N-acetylglucosamine transferase (SPINDLY family)